MNNILWSAFRLTDFFDLKKGDQNNMSLLKEGEFPLISARKCYNGYKCFVSKNNKRLFNGNIITLNNDGDGGAGIAFYQPYYFFLDSHVTALIPKIALNKYQLFFIATCITKQKERFGHGYSLNSSRLRSFKFMLPIDVCGQPYWDFMDKYMRQKEQLIIKPTLERLCHQFLSNEHKKMDSSFLIHKWTSFDFIEIFDIKKGFYNKKPPCFDDGDFPFIGATDSNNGVTGFSNLTTIEANSKIGYGPNESLDRKVFPGNAICVTNNGSVGYAYYQPTDFTCTHDVNPLYLKDNVLNRHIALFLIACIEKQRICFTYARKWRPKRMVHSKLLLPVDSLGNPDWKFMEECMKAYEGNTLKTTIKYFKNKLYADSTEK